MIIKAEKPKDITPAMMMLWVKFHYDNEPVESVRYVNLERWKDPLYKPNQSLGTVGPVIPKS